MHRSIIFGEAFGARDEVTQRVQAIVDVMAPADIQVQAVPDARVPIWDMNGIPPNDALVAAHRSLELGKRIKVEALHGAASAAGRRARCARADLGHALCRARAVGRRRPAS